MTSSHTGKAVGFLHVQAPLELPGCDLAGSLTQLQPRRGCGLLPGGYPLGVTLHRVTPTDIQPRADRDIGLTLQLQPPDQCQYHWESPWGGHANADLLLLLLGGLRLYLSMSMSILKPTCGRLERERVPRSSMSHVSVSRGKNQPYIFAIAGWRSSVASRSVVGFNG